MDTENLRQAMGGIFLALVCATKTSQSASDFLLGFADDPDTDLEVAEMYRHLVYCTKGADLLGPVSAVADAYYSDPARKHKFNKGK